MFSLLQKVGKALMTPIAVLPIAAILLRLGFGDIPYLDGEIANIMKEAGDAIFSNLDLLFAIGIAYGLAKNSDGAAALSAGVGLLISKAVYLQIDPELNMGVFIGIIIGILSGVLYNRFHTIKLPDFLGFFAGKRFVPIITSILAIFIGILAGYFWHYAQNGIDAFSNSIISLGEVGTFIYGTLNRLLIPLGLHHILNSVFWFQLGDFSYVKDGATVVANGDLSRFFAGDPTAGIYMSGFYIIMMFGLPSMALAIYLTTPKESRKKAGAILFGVAFTSFLTGITEPMEFLFMFEAPLLYLIHALLTGLALATAQFMDIHHGFGFSAGLFDYLINYKLAKNPILIIPIGLVFAVIYFIVSYYAIKIFKLVIFSSDEETKDNSKNSEAQLFIQALGGEDNIVSTDACITRLRMEVKSSKELKDEDFIKLGAKGVIRPTDTTIQVVLGAKAERVAEGIKGYV
ncbi:MAG TPA: PTS sugar transporter [Campylobacterales bacterium]|nr:PTS sugar transporter [Campylobacterales bacterium]